MEHQKPKKVLLNQLATVAKAMAHPNRLELLDQAAQGEQSVETLAEATGLSVGNASQHLQRLRRAGLLRARREGTRVLYSLADESVLALCLKPKNKGLCLRTQNSPIYAPRFTDSRLLVVATPCVLD